MKPVCATALLACVVLARPAASSPDSCDPGTREVVATVGDSILDSAEDDINSELGTTDFVTQGCAFGGDTISSCATHYNSYAHTGVDIVAWNCGINNIVQGSSAAAAWALAEAQLNIIRGEGVKVAAINLTPCAGYSGCNTTAITTFNTSLATWCTAQGAANCQLFDANAAVRNPAATDFLSAACDSGDHLHLSAACEATDYAPGIAAAVEAL
jgi:hypothetical protein